MEPVPVFNLQGLCSISLQFRIFITDVLTLPVAALSQKRRAGGVRRHLASICDGSFDSKSTLGKVEFVLKFRAGRLAGRRAGRGPVPACAGLLAAKKGATNP